MYQISLKGTLIAISRHFENKSISGFCMYRLKTWFSSPCVWEEDWGGRVSGAVGAGRSCEGACGRGCGGTGGGQGGQGVSCCLWRTGVRLWEGVQSGAGWGAGRRRGPGRKSWGPGCTRGTHRHAGPVLPESGTSKLKTCGFIWENVILCPAPTCNPYCNTNVQACVDVTERLGRFVIRFRNYGNIP